MRYLTATVAILAAGCATAPRPPADVAPAARLVPEEDLAGRLYGRGEFRSITGVRRAFDVTLDGAWDGSTLTLVEAFRYADGQNDVKTWRLRKLPDGRYEGVREDVVGTATGWLDDGGYRMTYTMAIPKEDGGVRRVRFRDLLVENTEGAVINKANVSYFGFPVASVDLVMQRKPFD